jgi:hypothetical protein
MEEFFFCHEINKSRKVEDKEKRIGEVNMIGYQNKRASGWYIISSFNFPGEKNIENGFTYFG